MILLGTHANLTLSNRSHILIWYWSWYSSKRISSPSPSPPSSPWDVIYSLHDIAEVEKMLILALNSNCSLTRFMVSNYPIDIFKLFLSRIFTILSAIRLNIYRYQQYNHKYNKKIKEFEDTKGVIKIRKSKKDRQHNGQKKKDKRTNNDLQNITHKTKDRVTRTPLKTGGWTHVLRRVSRS